jgi:hypothetical protein
MPKQRPASGKAEIRWLCVFSAAIIFIPASGMQITLFFKKRKTRMLHQLKLDNIRSYNGPEFVALALKKWLADFSVQTQYIEPGSPWENGYCESFNGKLRDKLLDGEVFMTLQEIEIVIENWRKHYNHRRPHHSLGDRPSAPLTSSSPALAKTNAGRRFDELKSENGNGTTTTSPFINPAMPYSPPAKTNLWRGIFRLRE